MPSDIVPYHCCSEDYERFSVAITTEVAYFCTLRVLLYCIGHSSLKNLVHRGWKLHLISAQSTQYSHTFVKWSLT